MIEQSKASLRLPDRKNDILTTPVKHQSTSKRSSFGISRIKTEGQISPGPESKNCFGDGSNPGQELGNEGVKEFVYQISNYIEHYSDKDISAVDSKKNVDTVSLNNKTFQENSNKRHRMTKSITSEEDRCYMKNLKLIQPALRKPERSPPIKKKIINNCARKRDQSEKNRQLRSIEFKGNATRKENPLLGVKDKKGELIASEVPVRRDVINKVTGAKRRKPSEIPLRKVRTDASRKPKAVSLLLKKPLKEVESSSSLDFYTNNKPFSPIDEVSLCSEVQITINAISSSDKLSLGSDVPPEFSRLKHPRIVKMTPSLSKSRYFNIFLMYTSGHFPKNCRQTAERRRKDTPVNSERPQTREKIFNVRLERCYNNLNIPIVSEITSTDPLEEKSVSGKKPKFLDLEKVKTSSFTVLQTNSDTLNRLESLHKLNVSSKSKVNSVNLKKIKPMTPKQLFNTIKRRTSRKSLPYRLSCTKNKSSLRIKAKKSKKDIQEDSCHPEKFLQPQMNATHMKAFKEVLEAKKINNVSVVSWGTGEVLDPKQQPAEEESKSLREKSVKPKVQYPKLKEESKIPTPQKYPLLNAPLDENSAKVAPPVNLVKSKVRIPKRKTVPDQNHIVLNTVIEQKEETEKNSTVSEKIVKKVTKPPEAKIPTGKTERKFTKDKNALVIRGTPLNFGKNENMKMQDKKKVKMQLKIDLNMKNGSEETCKPAQSCDWLYKNDGETPNEKLKEEVIVSSYCLSPESLSLEWAQDMENKSEASRETDLNLQETRTEFPFLKGKLLNNMSGLKTKRIRKKIRSDAGDRPLPTFSPFFGSDLLQNKVKIGTRTRNSLTKPNNVEEQREIFEEETPVKLRRRNSEPVSLSGFIWKRANFPIFRGHKPSVSSVASSLRHLNTDDFDDFIFWEPVPQKMTSCWEMSLYQFKRPWSVLSCSVFRDNRQSNTPGLILENLRNGGNPNTRQSARSQSERVNRLKENPFDVEPSIAQKNIDIRNWLAALNFPTSTSNSSDGITEGNFTSQSIVDSQNLNKTQVTPKRRKVFRNLNFLDKASKLISKDKIGRNSKEEENLRDLVRRKSGGFVINEHSESNFSIHRVNLNSCLASKSAEEKSLLRESENSVLYTKVLKKLENSAQLTTAESGTMVDETLHHSNRFNEFSTQNPFRIFINVNFERILKQRSKFLSSDINIWKYLFMLTLFIILIFYSFTNFS